MHTAFITDLHDHAAKTMYRLTLSRLSDEQLAMDLVQATFLTACKKVHELYDHENPIGWLYNTLRKLTWCELERAYRRHELTVADIEQVDAEYRDVLLTRQLGRIKEVLSDLRKNGYAHGRGEKYSLTLGHDISSVLSADLALLATKETTPLFVWRYGAKTLRQYARRDPVRKGHGDIIVCLDESYSTRGEKAYWGKALALAMQDICARGDRKCALIHFGDASEIKTDLFLPGRYGPAELLAAAKHFFDGGTDFEAPLQEAIRLSEDGGFESADVVFITDGLCAISEAFAEKLRAVQSARHFTIFGLLLDIGHEATFSLEVFCERVLRLSSLELHGSDREILSSYCA